MKLYVLQNFQKKKSIVGFFEISKKLSFFDFRRKQKRMRLAWLTATWLSVLGIIIGASLLLFGYLSEPPPASNVEFNYFLEWSRIFGLILFAIAGVVLAVCLLLPSFIFQEQCFVFDRSNLLDDDLPPSTLHVTLNHPQIFIFLTDSFNSIVLDF